MTLFIFPLFPVRKAVFVSNVLYLCIILCLCAVIPAVIVYCVLWSRLISDERRIDSALGSRDDINRIDQQYKAVIADVSKLTAELDATKETIQAYHNRLNARERVERQREKRAAAEQPEQEEMFPLQSIPQMPLQFPGQDNGKTEKKLVLRRKEG